MARQRNAAHVRRSIALGAALFVALGLIGPAAAPAGAKKPPKPRPQVAYWLTILHNNDGESQLIDAGTGALEDFGGVARFASVVKGLRMEASSLPGAKKGVLMLSSGDNFLAGPEFAVSLEKGVPFYDSIALDLIGYDAMAIGNHEFDFGPDVLADFIEGFRKPPPFLSANLDVSGEPRLAALEAAGLIAGSTVVRSRGERIGIVGATTPRLPFISSPRNVVVDPEVAAAIQGEVDALHAAGINKVILISHLQSIEEDLALASELSGIDVMIAGGGDELLANPGNLLIPGDEGEVFGPYPMFAMDADGIDIPVITTSGAYRYVGKLVVGFDRHGNVVRILQDRSGPVRVASTVYPDGVRPDRRIQRSVVEPLMAELEELNATVVAVSEVDLDGRRSSVRSTESNEGNLIADSLLHQARQLAGSFGAPEPDIALQNGGGIRNDSIIPAGNITEFDTFSMVPFPNFVSIVANVSPETLKELLENAVSRVEFGDGRFAQVAGLRFTWDAALQPRVLDAAGNVVTPGDRVREVQLDDGTFIVQNGAVVAGAPSVDVATIDFLARGGDQYPFGSADFVTLGVTYQIALRDYLRESWGLNGVISAADYPVGGEGRITRLN
jgi:2',3'-cyclic-nucleotide 2'-phosphodiesterase (5'-nucleotidase family)